MIRICSAVFVAFLLFLVPEVGSGQVVLQGDLVANGGTDCASLGLQLKGTVGQSLAGSAADSTKMGKGGFWYIVRSDTLAVTGVEEGAPSLPYVHRLAQNTPNPFTASTNIRFDLPRNEHVLLQVLDISGRRLAVLVDEDLGPGVFALEIHPQGWASGLYLYRLATPTFAAVRKFLYLR